MKRADFITIIKCRSIWKIDKRKGNYCLPNGSRLSEYIDRLVRTQMKVDNLVIAENGNLYYMLTRSRWDESSKDYSDITIYIPYADNETCTYKMQENRIKGLVKEIIG